MCIVYSHNAYCSKAEMLQYKTILPVFAMIKAAYVNESFMWEFSVIKKREVKSFAAV